MFENSAAKPIHCLSELRTDLMFSLRLTRKLNNSYLQ
ncbi:hypothetical protein VPHD480_0398 [Vibrio phage D480]